LQPPSPEDNASERKASGVTLRALVTGAVLIALGTAWVNLLEIVFHIGNQNEVVPPPSALVVFLVLSVLLLPLRLLSKKLRLASREMLVVFMMCMMALPMASQGLWGWYMSNMVGLPHIAYYRNQPEAFTYMDGLPDYVIVKDRVAIEQYATGVAMDPPPEGLFARAWYEFKGPVRWDVWLPVLGFWSILIITLFAVMMLMNAILRRPWLEGERLRFPIVVIPQALCDYGEGVGGRTAGLLPRVFGDRFFLLGLGAVIVFHSVAALHFYNPDFPGWPPSLLYRFSDLFTDPPLSSIRHIYFSVMPLMVGVFYFVDPGVMSSILIFYGITLLERFVGAVTGWSGYRSKTQGSYPFLLPQWYGGMIAYGITSVFFLRRHLGYVVLRAFGLRRPADDESDEPVSYPVAFWALLLCGVVLLAWSSFAGMGVLWGFIFFAFLILSTVAAVRIRGESGAPVVHMMAYVPFVLYAFAGTDTIGVIPACVMALLFFLVHGQYMMLAPTQMEALKVGEMMGVRRRGMYGALAVAFLFAFLVGGYVTLQMNYRRGALNMSDWMWGAGRSRLAQFDTANNWKNKAPDVGSPGDPVAAKAISVGAVVMTALTVMRRVFPRWPLHPVGYVIANSISADWFIGSVLVAWLLKTLILRLGGIRIYRKLMPMFIGFILGDAVMFVVFGVYGAIAAAFGITDSPFKMYVW